MCSKNLNELDVQLAIDSAFNNNIFNNFSICKYFEILNGKPSVFNKNSCYAHPNLLFGLHNNLYFNLQFSHSKVNNYFKLFTDNDIDNQLKLQYLCEQIYIYGNNLNRQFLNYNDINKNCLTPYFNDNSHKIQNYLNSNEIELKKSVLKELKL